MYHWKKYVSIIVWYVLGIVCIIPSDDQVWNESQAEIEQTAGRLEWLDPLPREVHQTRRDETGKALEYPKQWRLLEKYGRFNRSVKDGGL